MTEIIPDTSKYTELTNKMRALVLILEVEGQREYLRPGEKEWLKSVNKPAECLLDLVRCEFEYRIKPKPRELWAVYEANGDWLTTYSGKSTADEVARINDRTVVRFVEQP